MAEKIKSVLDFYPDYEATIGIEVHVQLDTKSKIFCSCPNTFGHAPNTNICPVCAGYPGTLPVLNRQVVDYAILTGLATNCEISKTCEFARKHYMYPDLPKNFQTSQGEIAICMNGHIDIKDEAGNPKTIRLNRIHMEEDAGKAMHMSDGKSYVDLNRAGTPLLEIVSEPDIASAFQAKNYLQNLRAIIQYIGVSEANMEEGSFRADINISVKKKVESKLGTRAEIKNVNSFKFIGQAIEYEIQRQIELLEDGQEVHQETRLWDESKQVTRFMRAKGDADDYRYFPEPDLPLIVVDSEWLERVKSEVPELPQQKSARFISEYNLTEYEAGILVQDKNLARYFENTVKLYNAPKLISNWILRDILGSLKEQKIALDKFVITPELLADLVENLDKDVINSKVAQDVFAHMLETGKKASVIIDEKDLKQVDNTEELIGICKQIIADNPDSVEKYKERGDRVFGFFVGQAMKITHGKGNPKVISKILKEELANI